jgi:hypothetical protein
MILYGITVRRRPAHTFGFMSRNQNKLTTAPPLSLAKLVQRAAPVNCKGVYYYETYTGYK